MEEEFNIKDIVKDKKTRFLCYRGEHLYYTVEYNGHTYEYPVPIEDIGEATFWYEHKAITLMRYIRKALKEGTFVKNIDQ